MTTPVGTEHLPGTAARSRHVPSSKAASTVLGVLKYGAPLAILAGLWQLLSWAGILNPKTVPSFFSVVSAGADLVAEAEIFHHLIVTVYRAEAGLLLGVVLGVALGLAMARVRALYAVSYPLVALTYTLPKTALIPIVFLWLGVGDASSIFVVFIGAFVPIVITTFHGAESVPEVFVWSAQSMGTSKRRLLWTVIFPAALPQILNGVRIAQAFSIVIVISAEMVASYVGVGRFIFLFGEAGNYNYMFASIFIVIIAAFVLDQLFLALKGWLLRWTEKDGASGA
ncbi:ABC transporter permease [Saxibacter everestensis]|uniref:ABC transporter permease n=1 Tax=Saxibacter everestensis TaxID=2909229 RepID=A0ABY8QRP7_9MICO|nr:ABC transporter permease [Brevibacteriaceae bacterium ZFBP1038]